MKIVGIIAEYNPFHRGHEFHIKKAKELTGADAVIVVMSGDYVQRGMPAILPKHLRAEMALSCGADVVLELPVCYATGSAEYFAAGAVSLLNNLGCVDDLCFGSECGDIELMQRIADILCTEPEWYKRNLQMYLKTGSSFPAARKQALIKYLTEYQATSGSTNANAFCDSSYIHRVSQILDSPNNILGIEYLKALNNLKSSIRPVTVVRNGSGYHDQALGSSMSSASAIRLGIKDYEENQELILQEIPTPCHQLFRENYCKRFPVFSDDFSLLLKGKLLKETSESLMQYLDVNCEIANRIAAYCNDFITFEQFCDLIKTKNMTYSRISRCLIHILLGIRKCDVPDKASLSNCNYARLLGFRTESAFILSSIKKRGNLTLISKLPPEKRLEEEMMHECQNIISAHLLQDIYASNLYESVITDKFHTPFINEYKKQIIRKKIREF